MTAEQLLSELLAFVYGDGGHYEHEHGAEKATWDAMKKVLKLRTAKGELIETMEILMSDIKTMLVKDRERRTLLAHTEVIMNKAAETW